LYQLKGHWLCFSFWLRVLYLAEYSALSPR